MLKVPPHRPSIRVDHEMRVYLYRTTKMRELDRLLMDSAWRRQPVLIGSGSVIESDEISGWLTDWRALPAARLMPRHLAWPWGALRSGEEDLVTEAVACILGSL